MQFGMELCKVVGADWMYGTSSIPIQLSTVMRSKFPNYILVYLDCKLTSVKLLVSRKTQIQFI